MESRKQCPSAFLRKGGGQKPYKVDNSVLSKQNCIDYMYIKITIYGDFS